MGKEVVKGDGIGDGQIGTNHLTPGLSQQIQKIATHNHGGTDSVKFPIPSDQIARKTWSTWTPTYPIGFSSPPANIVGKYIVYGKTVILKYLNPTAALGTSNSTQFQISGLPFTPVKDDVLCLSVWCADNTANLATPTAVDISSGILKFRKDINNFTGWTAAGGKGAWGFTYIYEMA